MTSWKFAPIITSKGSSHSTFGKIIKLKGMVGLKKKLAGGPNYLWAWYSWQKAPPHLDLSRQQTDACPRKSFICAWVRQYPPHLLGENFHQLGRQIGTAAWCTLASLELLSKFGYLVYVLDHKKECSLFYVWDSGHSTHSCFLQLPWPARSASSSSLVIFLLSSPDSYRLQNPTILIVFQYSETKAVLADGRVHTYQ